MILRSENPDEWLVRTELEAATHLQDAMNSWISFCKKALAIQESNLWGKKGDSWHDYVRQTWHIDSSRIRQYKAALPYAEKILLAHADLATPENSIRLMKKAGVEPENPDMPRIYKTVLDYAREMGEPIKPSFFEHAKKIYDEAKTTGGYVDIGEDEIVPIDWENSTKLAMFRSIDEANKRHLARLDSKRKPVEVRAKRIANNQYLITSDEPLPETFNFRLWTDIDETPQDYNPDVHVALDVIDKLEGETE